MPVYKRRYASGTILWYFKFQAPGAKRGTLPVREFGFGTKQEAIDAEAARRIEEQKKFELAKAGAGVAAAPPRTLSMLMDEFLHPLGSYTPFQQLDHISFGKRLS